MTRTDTHAHRWMIYLLLFTWSLSADGKRLALRSVNADLIPKGTRDSNTVVKILRENLETPELLKDAGHSR